jgi:hypothetical protein
MKKTARSPRAHHVLLRNYGTAKKRFSSGVAMASGEPPPCKGRGFALTDVKSGSRRRSRGSAPPRDGLFPGEP